MRENKIDIEQSHLVIQRDKEGLFRSFRWYHVGKFTQEELTAKIIEHNEKYKDNAEYYQHELITDRVVKEICAYREYTQPLEDLISSAKDVQESIDEAISKTRDALDYLERIRGLD